MNTIAIIQARIGSSRLPGKVLQDLGGQPVLAWVVRAASAIPGVARVVVATSAHDSDEPIVAWCTATGVRCHRGSEQDVLDRFLTAARAESAEAVMRLTADCPLLDPQVCGLVVELLRATGSDYACNFDPRSWPDGLDCEVFTRHVLEEAAAKACAAFDREHVTPYIRAHRHRFRIEQVTCPIPGVADQRWTLDDADDLAYLRAIVERLPGRNRTPSWLEVLKAIRAEPALARAVAPAHATQAVPAARLPAPQSRSFATSQAFLDRAKRVVPLGSQTFSKSHIQYPREAPMFLAGGSGAQVWDIDGNRYVDLVGGLLPIVLGYRDPDVDGAIRRQLTDGITFSLATRLETELAERLVEIIPCAEMVRYGKNGSDVTAAAVRLARAFTGRDHVAVCGYHGWQDWYIGATSRHKGVPEAVRALTHTFPYGDLAALERLLTGKSGTFAAVVMEPMNVVEPPPGYLQGVRDLAHQHGAILVFDEIITGFRFALGGAQAYFGVTPDLACFGKAMGNGMPISAVVGRTDIMREMEDVFFSGTFGGEALSLAAAIATLDKMRRESVVERLWATGRAMSGVAEEKVQAHNLGDVLSFAGLSPWRVLAFQGRPGASREAIKTVFLREMLQAGVLINASHNVSYAHGTAEIEQVAAAYDHALGVVSDEIARGDLDRRLGNDLIRPIFSVR
jgi:glutamate-1-semialdehyde 2,1-aminomutase/spore coat polysaccharide biosynthesis protein SpsF